MKFSRWHFFQHWLLQYGDHEKCLPFDWKNFMDGQSTPEEIKAQIEAGGIPSKAFGNVEG